MVTELTERPDAETWGLVRQGNTAAFEVLVVRYQSLVSAVAYSTCGDLALSEDLAQETFWTAWRQRDSLERPENVRGWLCGIARNLARNARRKSWRRKHAPGGASLLESVPTNAPEPAEEMISHEEEGLIWKALEGIPESYREPLVLFYREGQSVARVAAALGLSDDAIKQRLSRGRRRLQANLLDLVEAGLRRSRPGRRFTLTVMAGLAAHGAGVSTATAAAGAGAGVGAGAGMGKAAGLAGAGGAIGGLIGTFGGLFGGWLGTWLPAQAAATVRERDAILRSGRRLMVLSFGFVFVLLGLIRVLGGTPGYPIGLLGSMAVFFAVVAFESARLAREVKRIRDEPSPDDVPNETALRSGLVATAARIGARSYRSKASLFGIPVLDVQFAAPMPMVLDKERTDPDHGPKLARGWIAIGDEARGILLAIGGKALGLVALGGRTVGAVSVGGVAFGLIALGGLGVGALAIGGLGVGVYAFGGGSVGWRSAGGLAMGWDMACGGGAFARHAALGGMAYARDYALGGQARARHANDREARTVLLGHPFTTLAFTVMGQRKVLDRMATIPGPMAEATPPVPAATGAIARAAPGRFTLGNGLKVRIRPVAGATRTALVVLYQIGSDHDPRGRSGEAHLLEHLAVTAAAGDAPARTAAAYFRGYPDGCNAQTGDRYTVCATVFPPADLDRELKDAAARMGSLRITTADLDRERPRLLEEVANMFGRIPALGAINVARELARPSPEGGRKGGLPAHVQELRLDELRGRWERYYKPRNAILVLAGAVDEDAARRAVTDRLAGLPPGEPISAPGEPGPARAGIVREETARTAVAMSGPVACVGYPAPDPRSTLYAPFLVLAARFWAAAAPAGNGPEAGHPSVYFPVLDDPAMLAVSARARPNQSAADALTALDTFVAETIAPALRDGEKESARTSFAMFLGTAELPDHSLAQNPYGVAFSLARREQLGIDPVAIRNAFEALTERDLRRAADEVFDRTRRVGAWIVPSDSD
ncbi:sigma-70 family RNA polymerase sigma factor [Aquisphaera insulae]|uniref:sigma-70 family RNA polymerase sigma factor n=1 Tax=Aquisphaera insulae TaxID=2712864 RepID=UPI0013EA3215|nr:sigma-70 family RNA polymerase sigma factor [Aquisphaera insulae]